MLFRAAFLLLYYPLAAGGYSLKAGQLWLARTGSPLGSLSVSGLYAAHPDPMAPHDRSRGETPPSYVSKAQ